MIIDSHTHFFDPTRLGGVPFPPKDSAIYRPVLPEHFRVVSQHLGVTGTVVVEASPLVEDNGWILDLVATDPSVVGFIGNLDIRIPDFKDYVTRYSANQLFRGVRARGYEISELFEDTARNNLSFLSAHNLSLDVLAQPDELDLVARLASTHSDLKIVIDHTAHVKIDGGDPDPVWRSGIESISAYNTVILKLSRLPECSVEWPATHDPAYYRPTIEWLWKMLGSERIMWGSNWPVAEFASDYATTLNVVLDFLDDKSETEKQNVLWRTSQEVYGWDMARLDVSKQPPSY